MEPLVRLEGCKGVSGILHAYMSCNADNVKKLLNLVSLALELTIPERIISTLTMRKIYAVNTCNDV